MRPQISPAREAAFSILRKVAAGVGNSDSLLHLPQVSLLSPADRNLCTTLVFGVLRWQRVLDLEARRFFAQPGTLLPEDAWIALRAGAYQLLFLDRVPAHAALFESVEWLKASSSPHLAGMVNAVLRKISRLPKARKFDAKAAYPEWLVDRWRGCYGPDACQGICEAGQTEPPTMIRMMTPDAAAVERKLADGGVLLAPGNFLAAARRSVAGDVTGPQALRGKAFQLQDEGSQLVAELLGRAANGGRILDCCAAPGGKTAVLLENNPDAEVVACDVNGARLAVMRKRLAHIAPGRLRFLQADAALLRDIGPFDRILCDVPCSGTGTLARNPEIRHRIALTDLTRQAARQRAILSSALRLLAPGGRLLYATCSLEPEENEAVVEACLAALRGLERIDLREEFDRLERQKIVAGEAVAGLRATGFRDGNLRTLPGMHPCDGFFAVLIERRERTKE